MKKGFRIKSLLIDLFFAVVAGIVVGTAYFFFQNSNGFAPGGVGGLATITYHFSGYTLDWSLLMVAFNLPIFVLVSALINISPPAAIMAKMNTPPCGNRSEPTIRLPGHSMDTQKPVKAQAARPRIGHGESAARR